LISRPTSGPSSGREGRRGGGREGPAGYFKEFLDNFYNVDATAARLPALLKDLKVITIEGGPHNIAWTYPDEVNQAHLTFLTA
jgi:pimeloyl-ACP methyl ester carboxylesterase